MIKKNSIILNIFVVALLLLTLFCFVVSIFNGVAYAEMELINSGDYLDYISNFLGDRELIEEKVISDGGKNEFLLVETYPSGYAIFAIGDNEYVFVEGAKTANSPFFEFINEPLIYMGPMSYYIDREDYYFNIITKESIYKEQLQSAEYDFLSQQKAMESVPQPYSMQDEPVVGKTYRDGNSGYVFIKGADYFKSLEKFPKNVNNECGIIALCILLGYYDTYHNDNFITNRKYLDKGSYLNNSWYKTPTTTTNLREHLKEDGIGVRLLIPSDGFAMADMELKKTMKNYINNDCLSLSNDCVHYSGSIVNTHKNPRKLINGGSPVILVILNYEDPTDSQIDKKGRHCVVAYGYKDDTFVTHFGWDGYPEVYLSKYTAYAYYAMDYTGQHVHSKNAIYGVSVKKHYCGCGEVIID